MIKNKQTKKPQSVEEASTPSSQLLVVKILGSVTFSVLNDFQDNTEAFKINKSMHSDIFLHSLQL